MRRCFKFGRLRCRCMNIALFGEDGERQFPSLRPLCRIPDVGAPNRNRLRPRNDVPRTHRRAAPKLPRHTRPLALVAAIALLVGGMQFLSAAGADNTVITQVAGASDAGAVDVNRDGVADLERYGATSRSLSVGEQPREGTDLRLFL